MGFAMRKMLFVLLLCIIGVGFYRGWFTLSSNRDTGSNKIDVNLTVDPDKAKEDAAKVKEKTNELGDQAKEKMRSENN